MGSRSGKPPVLPPPYFLALSLEIGIVWLINYLHSFDISNSLQSGSSLNCGLMILQGPGLFLFARYFIVTYKGLFLLFSDIQRYWVMGSRSHSKSEAEQN